MNERKPIAQKFALNIVIVLFSGLKFYLPNAQCFFLSLSSSTNERLQLGIDMHLRIVIFTMNANTLGMYTVCAQCTHKVCIEKHALHANCNKGKHCFIYIRCVNDMIVSNGRDGHNMRTCEPDERKRKMHINNHRKKN